MPVLLVGEYLSISCPGFSLPAWLLSELLVRRGTNLSCCMEELLLKEGGACLSEVTPRPQPEFFNQTILTSPSTCLKSGSPVMSSAFDRLANAAAKQSAYDIRCLDLKLAAA